MQYPADAGRCLEEAYQAWQSTCTVCIHQYEYIINFRWMTQTNQATGKERPIRRTEDTERHAADPDNDAANMQERDARQREMKQLSDLNMQLQEQLAAERDQHELVVARLRAAREMHQGAVGCAERLQWQRDHEFISHREAEKAMQDEISSLI